MKTHPLSIWARANAAFHNKDFEGAIALYREALNQAQGPLKHHILFNLQLAESRTRTSDDAATQQSIPLGVHQKVVQFEDHTAVMRDIKNQFDVEFYLAKYPDIEQLGVDPLKHYCMYGWKEGRDPSSSFSTADYLELNPDVAAAGINPYWHFVVAGKAEGRETHHPGGIKLRLIKKQLTIRQMVEQWKKAERSPESMTAQQVTQLLSEHVTAEVKQLVISVSHDNYKEVSGGIQLCIQREEQLCFEKGFIYLNVHPWQPLPILASEPDPLVSLILAGKNVGICRSSVLTKSIENLESGLTESVQIIVHSLLGHSIEQVKKWVKLRGDHRCWVWLHDFFTLCPSYALQRNNVAFCGAPDIDSNACEICLYGDERRSHIQRMNDFFEETSVTAISPSEVTKQFWLSKAKNLPCDVIVMPHIEMTWHGLAEPIEQQSIKPISIGYLGGPVYHKGWYIFEQLNQIFSSDPRYRFVYFGNRKPPLSQIEHINIHVTSDDYLAMSKAISEARIDFVLHWPTWPETFSFTTHEAMIGGAFVLTNPASGNVAAAVVRTGRGIVFADEVEIFDFFKDGAAARMANIIRDKNSKQVCTPRFSGMTVPLLTLEGIT